MNTQSNKSSLEAELDEILKESKNELKQLSDEARGVADKYQNSHE